MGDVGIDEFPFHVDKIAETLSVFGLVEVGDHVALGCVDQAVVAVLEEMAVLLDERLLPAVYVAVYDGDAGAQMGVAGEVRVVVLQAHVDGGKVGHLPEAEDDEMGELLALDGYGVVVQPYAQAPFVGHVEGEHLEQLFDGRCKVVALQVVEGVDAMQQEVAADFVADVFWGVGLTEKPGDAAVVVFFGTEGVVVVAEDEKFAIGGAINCVVYCRGGDRIRGGLSRNVGGDGCISDDEVFNCFVLSHCSGVCLLLCVCVFNQICLF